MRYKDDERNDLFALHRIIGVVGQRGAGKDTFAALVQRFLPGEEIFIISYSSILKEILDDAGERPSTANLQRLGEQISRWNLQEIMLNSILSRSAPNATCVIPGLRTYEDVGFIRSFRHNRIVAISDNLDPGVRWQRVRKRVQRPGDAKCTWKQFCLQEQAPIEEYVSAIIALANFTLDNTGTPEAFEQTVRDLFSQPDFLPLPHPP